MEGRSGGGYRSPHPMGMSVCPLDLNLLYVAMFVGNYGIERRWIVHRKEQQTHVCLGAFDGGERLPVSVFGKPDCIGKTDEHGIVMPSKRFGTKQGIAQSLRLLLKHIKDLCRIAALGEISNNVSLLRGDHHTYLLGSRRDHAFDQILGDRFGALHPFDSSRTYGQKLFRTAQRLNALACSGCGNNSDHATSLLACGLRARSDACS